MYKLSGITAPDKKGFFMLLMTWLDFLAILPYFVLLFTKVCFLELSLNLIFKLLIMVFLETLGADAGLFKFILAMQLVKMFNICNKICDFKC